MAVRSRRGEEASPHARCPRTIKWCSGNARSRVPTSSPRGCEEGEEKEKGAPGRIWQRLVGMALLVSLAACAGPEPLLRSNKHLQLYGKQMAQQDVEACQRKAEEAGLRPGVHRSGNAAAGAGLGLTLGGAIGASAGLIGGGAGVAIGAAAGGGLGMIIGLIGGAYKPLVPDAPYADAVVHCLIEQGYEVSGWD